MDEVKNLPNSIDKKENVNNSITSTDLDESNNKSNIFNNINQLPKEEEFFKYFKASQTKLKNIINNQKEEYLKMEKRYQEIITQKDNEIQSLQNKVSKSSFIEENQIQSDNKDINKLSILLNSFLNNTNNILQDNNLLPENLSKKFDNQVNKMIEAINLFFEKQIQIIKKSYQERLTKVINENNKLKNEILKEKYLSIDIQVKEKIKKEKISELEEQIKDLKKIVESKESVINIEKEKNNILTTEYSNLQKECRDLQSQYNQSVFAFKMKEDEIDTLIMIIDATLNHKKGKYLHNLNRLSETIKKEVEDIINSIKIFKTK